MPSDSDTASDGSYGTDEEPNLKGSRLTRDRGEKGQIRARTLFCLLDLKERFMRVM